jgi:hypothetical protein
MRLKLIYPRWPKLMRQTEFHLPPHGPVVFAAALPGDVEVDFTDENLQAIDFEDRPDVVAISMMLTIQVKRGWEIADAFRAKGIPVIFGGIAPCCTPKKPWRMPMRFFSERPKAACNRCSTTCAAAG